MSSRRLALALATIGVAFACVGAEDSRLCPFAAIMTAPDAGPVEETSAIELQRFFEEKFGARVPILRDERPGLRAVRLAVDGASSPQESRFGERFSVRGNNEGVVVAGSEPRGVLQGVFWLQDWLLKNPPDTVASVNAVKTARFRRRLTMPYFAEAGKITGDYIRFMAKSGYNGIYLAFHPFKEYIDDPVPFPVSHIFRARDFVNTRDKDQLVAYVNDVFSRAQRYGLDGYLYLMEPWGGDKEFLAAHPDALGKTRQQKLTQPLCMSSPAAVDYIRNLAAQMTRNIPDLKGIIVMTEDGTTICDDSCPRCAGARPQRRATLLNALADGGKSVRPDFHIVAYTWWWEPEDFATVIPLLPRDSVVCTRTSTHAPFALDADWKGTPGDVSLIVDGPGQDFRAAVGLGKERGIPVVDMLAISNGHELIMQPGMPAPDRYARKLDVLEESGGAGWISYDCGGLTNNLAAAVMQKALWLPVPSQQEMLRELASDVYGKRGAENALKGWQTCSAALGLFPVEIDKTPVSGHRQGPSMTAMAPLVPFTVANAAAYDNVGPLGEYWKQFKDDRAVVLKYFPQICKRLEEGVRLLQAAATTASVDGENAAEEDVRAAQAVLYSFRSGLNIENFWDALSAASRATTQEAQADVRQKVEAIVAQECTNTEHMLNLVRQDERLFYCACTKYVHPLYIYGGFLESGYFEPDSTVEAKLRKKLDSMKAEDFASELENLFPSRSPAQPAP